MTTQLIRSDFASSSDAALNSRAPRFLVQILNEGTGTTRVLERPPLPESVSSEQCVLFHVMPVQPSPYMAGYDDFDRLSSEAAAEAQDNSEVVRGREWVASAFGNGDLASLRLAAGLSQSQLALLCDVEQPHVSRYESGRHEPLISTAGKMAKALGVPLEVFVNAWNLSRASSDRGLR